MKILSENFFSYQKTKNNLTWQFHGVALEVVAVLVERVGREHGLLGLAALPVELQDAELVVHHRDDYAGHVDLHLDWLAGDGHEVGRDLLVDELVLVQREELGEELDGVALEVGLLHEVGVERLSILVVQRVEKVDAVLFNLVCKVGDDALEEKFVSYRILHTDTHYVTNFNDSICPFDSGPN